MHRCLNNARRKGLLASLLPEHSVFRSPVVQSPIPGAGDLAGADDRVQIFASFRKSGTGSAHNWPN